MPFFGKFVSLSSSLPSSPSVLPYPITKDNNSDGSAGNSMNSRDQSLTPKRLERQRKLRHVTEQDLGLNSSTDRLNSAPGSPDAARKSRSPGGTDHRPSVAVPQPLPLPESFLTGHRGMLGLILGQSHPGSAEEGQSHALRGNSTDQIAAKPAKSSSNFRERFCQHANAENTNGDLRLKIPVRSAPTSGFSSPAASPRRSFAGELLPSHAAADSTKSSSNSHPNVEGANYNCRWITSPRSAPTSSLPSPAFSPQRSNTGDFLPSFEATQEFQFRSALEIQDLGTLASRSSQLTPVKTILSPDHSPLHSPRLQNLYINPKGPVKFAFPSRCKLIQGSSKEWPESTSRVSAHPLPLPPGATSPHSSMTSPPAVIHHTSEKLNVQSQKTQWVKGKLIGSGTYGRVYIGTHRMTGASCAMKEVNIIPDDSKSTECIKQLEQEIRVLRHLKHQNIVQYYGSEIVDDYFYIYLEYVNPGSINKYVQEHCGHMTESIVRNFTRHIVSGLGYLHSKKTVHRDIKGANLLVDASGVVKLADFGMAKHLTGLSYQLSLKGSPHWMAPEVIKAVMLKNCSPDLALAVDIWSLGCTIIEMFTGKPPWGELHAAQAMFKILNKDPPIPENLSPEGKDFLRCCFRRNPAERPSAAMLLEHPFVCKSNDLNASAGREGVCAVNLVDSSPGSRCRTAEIDAIQKSPHMRLRNPKLQTSSETSQQSNVYKFHGPSLSHHPPCSVPAARPYLSTGHHSSHNFGSPSHASNNAALDAANNHPLAILRSHGREIPHV